MADRDSIVPEFEFDFQPSRREFLAYIGALLAASGCGDGGDGGGNEMPPPEPPVLTSNPFTLGVASGDPLPESVILWTRLTSDPIRDDTMPDAEIPVIWEMSLDADFRRIARSGWQYAQQQFGHSVHIDADGLRADTWYYYRMRIGDQWTSPVGRTRTLPAANSKPEKFRVASASCQNYRDGYYHAHALLAQEDVDLVFFLGDYIYESGVGEGSLRQHEGPSPETLTGYRNRYGRYKSDPNLQASHRAFPWVTTWDDHELVNNYAGLYIPGKTEEEVLVRRRAAYQAYYEHQALRVPLPTDFGHFQIYRGFEIGDLARVSVLDTRQYRDPQPCNGNFGTICPDAQTPGRTLLGAAQKEWLKDRLAGSTARWNIVAQQIVFAPIIAGRALLNPDQWDGYAAERQELLDVFATLKNVVVFTGDIHAAGFAELKKVATDFTTETVGYEVVATSITSGGSLPLQEIFNRFLPQNPHLHHVNANNRGFSVTEFGRDAMRVEFRIVESVLTETTTWRTEKTFDVERATLACGQCEGPDL